MRLVSILVSIFRSKRVQPHYTTGHVVWGRGAGPCLRSLSPGDHNSEVKPISSPLDGLTAKALRRSSGTNYKTGVKNTLYRIENRFGSKSEICRRRG